MKTLIKNAKVVTSDGLVDAAVLIEGSKIAAIDPAIQTQVDQSVDATGHYLLPGLIDDQVHFRDPGLTHKEDLAHASRACAKGGVTSFLEMPNTIPNATRQKLINDKLELASKTSLVNYGFYIGATPDNLDELKTAVRTPGIKIFIGSSTGDLLVDNQDTLERIFAETTLRICAHCEDEATVRANQEIFAGQTDIATHSKIRNHEAAVIATKRSIDLATRHNHPFHVLHVSTADEVELISTASNLITAEVCPHHLFFNVDDYDRLGSQIKMNPSIKTRHDNAALFEALLDGTIEVVATDHAPHTLEEKAKPYPECPSGLPAVENSLALMLNEVSKDRCTINQVASWMSTAPARVWDIKSKGRIEVGYDADLVLIDLELKQKIDNATQQTKSKWSPWHGTELTGWAIATWVMGRQVMKLENGQYNFDETRMGSEILYEHS